MENKRKLGKSDLLVSPLTFGGNVFGWTLNETESFKILDAFVAAGLNFIDTADTYSTWIPGNKGGESETIIGNWLKKSGKRADVIIATKLGGDMGDGKKGLSARYIKEEAEASLKRLQTDYIDLYQSHYDDPETPVSETMTALNELIKEGKVRYIGASNLSADRIKESNDFARKNNVQPYISLQPLYNLYDRQKFENEYLQLVTDEGLGVIPYYSLASGFLSGKYRSDADLNKSPRGQGIKQYLDERGLRILAAMDKIAGEQHVPLSQLAISWLLHKPYIASPIASATSEEQLKELIHATTLQLNEKQMAALDEASAY
ncbi:aldo/keto reductase [Agriterribacter sp.]|uniref:aldo/keto reductase n=1 Tax=Agriterribacter sp. TaxID=2821509 RepID=UPI002C6A6573|nr:aldo/keto reductase [Agriterribacter sp.]HRO48166.1 aldo/keto reductase [Agriterribacter sp.]HRQ19094.1 aldo/keto reductase [Agriterribacter sp.]